MPILILVVVVILSSPLVARCVAAGAGFGVRSGVG
jgi:hypothetical protein